MTTTTTNASAADDPSGANLRPPRPSDFTWPLQRAGSAGGASGGPSTESKRCLSRLGFIWRRNLICVVVVVVSGGAECRVVGGPHGATPTPIRRRSRSQPIESDRSERKKRRPFLEPAPTRPPPPWLPPLVSRSTAARRNEATSE